MEQRIFAASHSNKEIRKTSSSGGAFSAVTDVWFSRYGGRAVVYGCALDDNLRAVHIRAASPQQRDRMRGSKYIGSDLSGIFLQVEEDLRVGNYVVFSGTPCQIGGLKAFLDARKIICEDTLLTVEVICHGVGSVRFFEDYIRDLERRYKSPAIHCSFRAKSRPGKKQDMQVRFANGKIYQASSTRYDWFYSVYLKDQILRPSCYNCRYSRPERVADISIADHWGEEKTFLEGRSLIIANTEPGLTCVQAALESMTFEEISFDQIRQPHMNAPCKKPTNYDRFWELYRKEGYLSVQKYMGNGTAKGRAKAFLANVMYRLHLIEAVKAAKIWLRRLLRKA